MADCKINLDTIVYGPSHLRCAYFQTSCRDCRSSWAAPGADGIQDTLPDDDEITIRTSSVGIACFINVKIRMFDY